ncbi:MAG: hypothetical protein SXA11_11735 [Cyanobacteriota bacterium]|nr:hypothetical protein [Cyanobacteriota bacterium]
MKPETEQNLATIEILTDGLSCSSVGTEPYGILFWEVDEKGEFSFLKFLIEVKALTPLEVEEFLASLQRTRSKKTFRQYKELINLLESNLSQLQFYSYNAPYLSKQHTNFYAPYENIEFPLIIGSTPQGEWLAIAPWLSSKTGSTPPHLAIPSLEPTATTANLIDRIETVTGNLARKTTRQELGENTNKWKVVVTSNPSNSLEKVLDNAGYINIDEIDRFWNVDLVEEAGNYFSIITLQELKIKEFFKQQLIYPRVYNLYFYGGEYQVHYVLGKNRKGDTFCLFTDTYSW